tara:strand:+ start:1941 stop:2231 length:291 start_codon:yes stop_codon:yes gene_type:complete
MNGRGIPTPEVGFARTKNLKFIKRSEIGSVACNDTQQEQTTNPIDDRSAHYSTVIVILSQGSNKLIYLKHEANESFQSITNRHVLDTLQDRFGNEE